MGAAAVSNGPVEVAQEAPAKKIVWLETITKAVAFGGVALFVVGLFVTNLYLREYGFADFALVRTRYILTGATALAYIFVFGGLIMLFLLVLAVLLLVVLHKTRSQRWENETEFPEVLEALKKICLSAVLLTATIGVIGKIIGGDVPLSLSALAPLALPSTFASALFGIGLFIAFQMSPDREASPADDKKPTSLADDAMGDIWKWLVAPVLITTSLLTYFYLYSTQIYPLIPEQWGGGKPRHVRFVVKAENLRDAETLGLIADPETQLTPAYLLIWESETQYLVRPFDPPNSDLASQIDRQLISGVISSALLSERNNSDADRHERQPTAKSATPQVSTPIFTGR